MPKIKTHKSTSKRFTITKTKKVIHRNPGQDHFNARETGASKRAKRRDLTASTAFERTVKVVMPYN
jgi:large subunit ribosomal protein L35